MKRLLVIISLFLCTYLGHTQVQSFNKIALKLWYGTPYMYMTLTNDSSLFFSNKNISIYPVKRLALTDNFQLDFDSAKYGQIRKTTTVGAGTNIAIGSYPSFYPSAYGNTFYGDKAGTHGYVTSGNTFMGFNVGHNHGAGGFNVGIGYRAFEDGDYGVGNVAIGYTALGSELFAQNNVAIGFGSAFGKTSISQCTYVGWSSGSYGTDSDGNVGIGGQAAASSTGGNAVCLGNNAGFGQVITNKFILFNKVSPSQADLDFQNTALIYGDFSTLSVKLNGELDHSAAANKPKIYSQATEPNISDNTTAFWIDTDDNSTYLILDISGTQKKTLLQ